MGSSFDRKNMGMLVVDTGTLPGPPGPQMAGRLGTQHLSYPCCLVRRLDSSKYLDAVFHHGAGGASAFEFRTARALGAQLDQSQSRGQRRNARVKRS